MNRTLRFTGYALIILAFMAVGQKEATARISSGTFRRYMQQQQQAQTKMMQMQQKAMQEAMARQAAYEKALRERRAAASKARHDKEEQHRQDLINKRKAESETRTTDK